MSLVVVGSTVPAHAVESGFSACWVENAERIRAANRRVGVETLFCGVLQHDDRGRGLFEPLVRRLEALDAHVTWFSLDVGASEWTTSSRLTAIVTGRNLIIDYAQRQNADFIYSADSDISAPDNVIVRLLELDHPVSGAHIPAYCLDGPRVNVPGDVREHWNSAGSLLVAKDVFRRVPWRVDFQADDKGTVTDDPCTQGEMRALGFPTWVRHDVVCRHNPEHVQPFEDRGLDRTVYGAKRSAGRVPTHVVIPYRDNWARANSLIDYQLRPFGGWDHIHVFDNSRARQPPIPGCHCYWAPGWSIYEMWNEAWDRVLKMDKVANIAFLNDDIEVPANFLHRLAEDLRSDDDLWLVYPDYRDRPSNSSSNGRLEFTRGSFRHGGMCGWAFMVRAEARALGLPRIDEQFRWWCGDDDLAFSVEKAGRRQACSVGLRITHLGSATARDHPELHTVGNEDLRRCRAKWGE